MTFGSRSGVTSESQAGSSGLQSAGFNMLGATPNPLKQRPLLLRLLCLPYPQEAGGTHKFARRGTKNWCGEGDLNSRTTLKTRKLYRSESSQNTRSARNTPPSHTTSHTACFSALQYIAAAPESRSAQQHVAGSQNP